MKLLSPMIKIALRYSRHSPLQVLLLVFGISLGVSGVVAIDVAKKSVSKSFELSTASLTSRSTHQIVGSDFSVPQKLLTVLRTKLGIKKSAPIITSDITIPELGGEPMTLMGVDPFSEIHFRQLSLFSGKTSSYDFSSLMNGSASVLLSRKKAAEKKLNIKDTITLAFGTHQVKASIAGFLDSLDENSNAAFQGLVIADISFAQEILKMGKTVSRIDLILENQSMAGKIKALLPQGVVLIKTKDQNKVIRQLSKSFETSLTAFSMLALFMGIFLIYNTVSFSITRKKKLHGILRSFGLTQASMFFAVISETMIYAVIGSLIGLALGVLMGNGAIRAVCSTVSEMYFVLTVTESDIGLGTLLKGFFAGVLSSFAAALYPAIDASRTLPVNLMQRSAAESTLKKYMPALTALGVLIIILSMMILRNHSSHPGFDFSGIFLIFLGASLMTPAFVVCLVKILETALGKSNRGMLKMSLRNIVRSLSRTSVLIASLMVVISVYIGISTMTGSFKNSIIQWVDDHIGGDIHVSSSDTLNRSLNPELLNNIYALPEVSDVSAYNIHRFFSQTSGEVHIFSYITDLSKKQWIWMAQEQSQLNNLLDLEWIFVSEIFVQRNRIKIAPGASVILQTSKGPIRFKIAGVFRDFFMGGGRVIVSRNVMDNYFGRKDITSLQIFLKSNTQVGPVLEKIKAMTLENSDIRVVSGAYIKQSILKVFDKTFLITAALQVLTAIVALTGILNSVMALLLERTRELGILRASGAQKITIFNLLLSECALSGFISGLLALPLGAGLSWILIHVINQRSFGWTYDMVLSIPTFLQALTLAAVAAAIAGIYPAIQAGRVDIKTALHME